MHPRLATLTFLCLSVSAQAGVLIPTEPGSSTDTLSVRKQRLSIVIGDQLARATLDEVFENLTDRPLEATYRLPLPDGAAVSGFATWIDGQRVESRMEEKAEAEKTYEAAKRAGRAPALLAQKGNTFETRVASIAPRAVRRIEARYAYVLPYDAGLVTLRVPLRTETGGVASKVGSFELSVDVADQKRITELRVHSAPAEVKRTGPGSFTVRLQATDVALPDDLVVTYRTESNRLGLTLATHRPQPQEDGFFLLLASPQELTTQADLVRKDVVFVFDVSGSMASNGKIDQAREALKRCLASLNPDDRFGVVAFDDGLDFFRNALVPANAANVQAALTYAENLRAEGGTNIHGAVLSGLKLLDDPGRPRVLLMMTDGQPTAGVTDPAQIALQIKAANSTGARLFTFGVGEDVNRDLLFQLAAENRGTDAYVLGRESIEQVVGGFYEKISKPVLADLSLTLEGVTIARTYPDTLPDLYKGSQLVLAGRYRGAAKVKGKLAGLLNGKRVEIPFDADFPAVHTEDAFVANLWAQRRIAFLLGQIRLHGEQAEAKTEVIALSRRYHVVTPYTSLVAARPDALLASVSPARVKPGDPQVVVRAPADAKVLVHLPAFGETKRPRWDHTREAWVARFVVPAGTPDGSYPVVVEVAHRDGRHERIAQTIAIDTRAPALSATASRDRRTGVVALRAQAVLQPLEVVRALLGRPDVSEAAKALVDVRAVSARLWDGREVPLRLDPHGVGFTAVTETPVTLAPGSYPVVFTAQDFAGNVARATGAVEVLP